MRILCYVNQFFGGIGGEDKADEPLSFVTKPVGLVTALAGSLGPGFEFPVVAVCGDNYFNSHSDEVSHQIVDQVQKNGIDLLLAGPAFNAGRYGHACGKVCETVGKRLNIACLTAMHPENPAVEMYRRSTIIVPTAASAGGMKDALAKIAVLVKKIAAKQPLGTALDEGYISRGIRKHVYRQEPAAKRLLDMVEQKLKGEPFITEVPIQVLDKVAPAPPVADLGRATIALVTTGGLVPRGNPDRLRSLGAEKWAAYSLEEKKSLSGTDYETVHGGFNPNFVNANPNYVVPLNILREFESEKLIGRLHPKFYSTVGVGAAVKVCQQDGREIASELHKHHVDAVILTST